MINVHKLSVSFSGEAIFSEISFRLGAGDRVGLVGRNGAGKSTLLKVLAGELEPGGGEIAYEKELKIGMLKQDIDFDSGRTVLEEAYLAFDQIKKTEKELERINTQLAERTDYKSQDYHQLMVDLNDLQHRYEIHGGYAYQGQTEQILKGLGFEREDFDKKTETFSGGWRMRIELAKLLLRDNDVLLLDEPTNHLDIESIIWFESFLTTFPGSVVVVSHDKMFLDHITNRTIEISLGSIYDYNKAYSEFLLLRQERREQQMAAQKNQQKQIDQTERLIERFRAKATKASMAQSLIKKLDRMERIEVNEEDNATMHIKFPVSVQPGKVVVEMEDVSKNYGAKKVLKNLSLHINRNSRTAFVGQNGQGKSTLAKIIVGEIDCTGHLRLGHNVQIGYFAQNQADYLDPEKTVLDTMTDAADIETRSKVRDILGAFLFRGEDVDKYVKVLSGGERNRLALAKMLLSPFNVLIMDEPTNHLDIPSKNVLKNALKNFEGTLILVSHDRDFLRGLTNVVYEFKDHKIKEYLGDIDFYLESRDLENMRQVEQRAQEKTQKQAKTKTNNYELQKECKALKNKIGKIEKQITSLEKTLEEKDLALALDYEKTAADPEFFDRYQKEKSNLDALMNEWEALLETYEEKSAGL